MPQAAPHALTKPTPLRERATVVVYALGLAAGCSEQVPLGSWLLSTAGSGTLTPSMEAGSAPSPSAPQPEAGEPESAQPSPEPALPRDAGDATTPVMSVDDIGMLDAGPEEEPLDPFSGCGIPAEEAPLRSQTGGFSPNETLTDWVLPASTDHAEWDLMIEAAAPDRSAEEAPATGAYWHQRFSFEQGVTGRFGIQEEGGYQRVPSAYPEFTRMAVFWLSGPPIRGELGPDITDGRVAEVSAGGVSWSTIHTRFAWELCHVYRFRVALESESDEGVWYGAWIEDRTEGSTTFLGRMLMPSDVGLLVPQMTSVAYPLDFGQLCAPLRLAAVFGAPFASEDAKAVRTANRFSGLAGCGTSRVSDFAEAVRHELGVAVSASP